MFTPNFWRKIGRYSTKLLHFLPPEISHKAVLKCLKYGYYPDLRNRTPGRVLSQHLFDRDFPNPIGMAAGFDKNAEVILPLFRLGFGFVEVGSVTLFPQEGNPKPRLFRLPKHRAIVNRMGFNNIGVEKFSENVEKYHFTVDSGRPLGINFSFRAGPDGVSKHDQLIAVTQKLAKFTEYGDYFVFNISSPNTKGVRDQQFSDELTKDLAAIRKNLPNSHLLVKISPDLNEDALKHILKVIEPHNINGLIIANTLPNGPDNINVDGPHNTEVGGLSGKPIKDYSTKLIGLAYKHTKGKLPIVGVGGVFNGKDAYAKIKAGACLIQIYTSLIYKGPDVVTDIKKELKALILADGYKSITEAIGADHK